MMMMLLKIIALMLIIKVVFLIIKKLKNKLLDKPKILFLTSISYKNGGIVARDKYTCVHHI